jgi:quercetin dioxygenase-like cupin family protein
MLLRFGKDTHVPAHSHGGQFGCVITGRVEVVVEGVSSTYSAGAHYEILAGQVHEAWIHAGTFLIEFFEEVDRY